MYGEGGEWEKLRGREGEYGFRINNFSLNITFYFPKGSLTNSIVTLSIQGENIFFLESKVCMLLTNIIIKHFCELT